MTELRPARTEAALGTAGRLAAATVPQGAWCRAPPATTRRSTGPTGDPTRVEGSRVFALAGGAWARRRGLVPWPIGGETVFFAGHAVGAAGSVLDVALLIAGLVR